MKSKHTPTPWKQVRDKSYITTKNGKAIALTSLRDVSIEKAIFNAEFIVKACNNHEALVIALEGCLSYLKNTHPDKDFSFAEKILKVAKG